MSECNSCGADHAASDLLLSLSNPDSIEVTPLNPCETGSVTLSRSEVIALRDKLSEWLGDGGFREETVAELRERASAAIRTSLASIEPGEPRGVFLSPAFPSSFGGSDDMQSAAGLAHSLCPKCQERHPNDGDSCY